MTTEEMLQALTTSTNENVREIATNIIDGADTIENQKKICGNFLLAVFDGDTLKAFRCADNHNKHAFLRWLIVFERQDEAQQLIDQQYQ